MILLLFLVHVLILSIELVVFFSNDIAVEVRGVLLPTAQANARLLLAHGFMFIIYHRA
jgi:hypothetical protein